MPSVFWVRISFLGALLLFLADWPGWAEESESALEHLRFSSLGTVQGLSSDRVTAVAHDASGYVWLATDRGLNRFDGFEVHSFFRDPKNPETLSSDRLTALCRDNKNVLWVGTADGGLNRFDPVTTKAVLPFRMAGESMKPLVTGRIECIAFEKETETLWVATDSGLFWIDIGVHSAGRCEGEIGHGPVASLCLRMDGGVWAAGFDGKLYRNSPRERGVFEMVWEAGAPIRAIAEESTGKLWIGTDGAGLFSFQEGERAPVPVTVAAPGPGESATSCRDVTALWIADTKEDLWVGTSRGLFRRNRIDGTINRYRRDLSDSWSLGDDSVTSIWGIVSKFKSEKAGVSEVLWVGTEHGGASRAALNRNLFPHVAKRTEQRNGLVDGSVYGMVERRDGSVWIGTEGGVNRWDRGSGEFALPLAEFSGLPTAFVTVLAEDPRDRLWMGTRGGGVVRLSADGRRVETFRAGSGEPGTLAHDSVSEVFVDSSGGVWIGTLGEGVSRYFETEDGARGGFQRIEVDEESSALPGSADSRASFISAMCEDGLRRVWVGAWDGLFLVDATTGKLRSFRTEFPRGTGLSSNRIADLLADSKGRIWVATEDNGLNCIETETGDIRFFNSVNSELPGDQVFGVLEDNEGGIWVSTDHGIGRLIPETSEFRVFDVDDGLQGEVFHSGARLRLRSGRLIFGGMNGFNVIDPARLPTIRQIPQPVLTGLEMFGEPVVPEPGGEILRKPLAATGELKIPYDARNRIAFRFATLDFASSSVMFFRYRLEGLEESWTLAENDRRATYTSLSPRRYTFIVQSSLDGKVWNENAARVAVVITPAWYRTWWAMGGYGVIVVLLGYLLVRSRLAKQKNLRQQAEAERDRAEAELARHLQQAVLIERTSREFGEGGSDADAFFQSALRRLREHFGACRCILRVFDEENSEGESDGFSLLAEECAPGAPSIREVPLPPGGLAVLDRFGHESGPFTAEDILRRPQGDRFLQVLKSWGSQSFLAMRTACFDQPNGLIILQQCNTARAWLTTEAQLLETVAHQIGMAIAQHQLSLREERQRAELDEARCSAEAANQAKSQFLARMTHEIRTPLNAILGFSQIIRNDRELTPRQRENIEIINQSGEHLLNVINSVLDLSKIEAGKFEVDIERFEFDRLLASVREMLVLKATERGLKLDIVRATALPRIIDCDKNKLRQILINLLGNAIKFTNEGGITLSCWAQALGSPETVDGIRRRGIRLWFEIVDTGCGIPEEEIPLLFGDFNQTSSGRRKEQGSGLGLSISRSFVEMLGGEIDVTSVLGEGTTFRFSVMCDEVSAPPVVEAVPESEVVSEAGGGAAPRHRANLRRFDRVAALAPGQPEYRILVADDQPANRLLLHKFLEPVGFVLKDAEDGVKAVEGWRDWRPHLILMDEEMPRQTGLEATREIVAACEAGEGERPVIISMTAFALEMNREAAMAAGCVDFVPKPFRMEDLFEVLQRHLGVEYVHEGEEIALPG